MIDTPVSPHILITGATGGLGQALALQYAENGHLLSLFGRNEQALGHLKLSCERKGARVDCYSLDLLDTDVLIDTIVSIDRKYPITLAIANAGITSIINNDHVQESLENIHSVIDINLKATLSFLSPIIDAMQQREAGQIALICSLASYMGFPITPAYCASKAGLKAYGDAIRPLLKKKNIYLSVVCPGFIETKMSEQYPAKKRFMLSPEQAAHTIVTQLRRRKPIIAFPFPLNLGSWFIGALPAGLSDRLVMLLAMCHR